MYMSAWKKQIVIIEQETIEQINSGGNISWEYNEFVSYGQIRQVGYF
mgnify:FL=1